MLKYVGAILILALFSISSFASTLAVAKTDKPQVMDIEVQEAQEIAIQFTLRFAQSKDIAPIVKDLYFSDFIERYIKSRAKNPDFNSAPQLYFVPGLNYNSRLLTDARSEEWQRFYTTANNFLIFGFISGIKNYSDNADIKVTDIYPPKVIKLLDKNPNLANMIVKKGRSKAISTVVEMRDATATLEQAVTIMREKQGKSPLKIDSQELVKLIKDDNFFKPHLEVIDEEFFDLPKGTRVLFIKTPLGLQLMLARDRNKLKIFWTEIIAD